ncbi:hypothetical protein SPAN111604_11610 [Sphingomonas antarctica]
MAKVVVKIAPIGIQLPDQVQLPTTFPSFHLLFSRDRIVDPVVMLGVDQSDQALFLTEFRPPAFAMLLHSRREI